MSQENQGAIFIFRELRLGRERPGVQRGFSTGFAVLLKLRVSGWRGGR